MASRRGTRQLRGERDRRGTAHEPVRQVQGEILSQEPALIVLIPSPLLGPFSWSLVAGELEARGWPTIIPSDLRDAPRREPAWRHTTEGVLASLRKTPSDRPVVLIGTVMPVHCCPSLAAQ